jgi:hypothetical protein
VIGVSTHAVVCGPLLWSVGPRGGLGPARGAPASATSLAVPPLARRRTDSLQVRIPTAPSTLDWLPGMARSQRSESLEGLHVSSSSSSSSQCLHGCVCARASASALPFRRISPQPCRRRRRRSFRYASALRTAQSCCSHSRLSSVHSLASSTTLSPVTLARGPMRWSVRRLRPCFVAAIAHGVVCRACPDRTSSCDCPVNLRSGIVAVVRIPTHVV